MQQNQRLRPRLGVLIAALWLLPVGAGATTFGYDAYRGKTKVGTAEVTINTNDAGYEIRGEARTVGMFDFLTKWRGWFKTTGRLVAGKPVAEEYAVTQKDRKKKKEIYFEDGRINYRKDGKYARSIDPLASLDLLSALFLAPGCGAAGDEIHTGKDRLSITLKEEVHQGTRLQCEFDVVDEDQQEFTASVVLDEINGIRVPVRLDVWGTFEGTLRLRNAPAATHT